jgi:hypothetical protein
MVGQDWVGKYDGQRGAFDPWDQPAIPDRQSLEVPDLRVGVLERVVFRADGGVDHRQDRLRAQLSGLDLHR